MKEYEILRSTLEYTKQEYEKINVEYQKLKERLSHTEHHGQLSHEELRSGFREK